MIEYIPGLAGVPATESKISSIDGKQGILAYRGYSVEALARDCSFEEVVLLLLHGEIPDAEALTAFQKSLQDKYRTKSNISRMMWSLPFNGHPMDVLQMAIAGMATFYPEAKAQTPDSEKTQNAMIRIISNMSTLVAMWQQIRNGYDPIAPQSNMGYAENFLHMFFGGQPSDQKIKLFNALLVLHAEHTINASTFSAMVTASTLANPFASISSAVGTLAGPLHGGANEKVLNMLDEVGTLNNVRPWLENRVKNKQVIWGMGHREYKTKDPRASFLQGMLEDYIKTSGLKLSQRFEIALEIEKVCEELLGAKGVYPNVDFYSGIIYAEIFGFTADQFTPIFAIARTAGWIAHWKEQVSHNRIFRPTQIYTGHPMREY